LGYELIEFWVTGDEVVEKTAEPDTASDAV
jgi:hypothetical protein